MKYFWVIIIVSLIVFILYRTIMIVTGKLLIKIFKADKLGFEKWDVFSSIASYLIFISIFIAAVEATSEKYQLSDVDYYTTFCILGISSIIWCYFKWDIFNLKSLPKLIDNSRSLRIKKGIVFFFIFVFVVKMGYEQTLGVLYQTPVDSIYSITNTTIIAAAIALDRFMNQLHNPK